MIEIPTILYYILLALPGVLFIGGIMIGLHDGRILGRSERTVVHVDVSDWNSKEDSVYDE
jgi:hypothetical protein